MKKFLTVFFAATLFSTAGVYAAENEGKMIIRGSKTYIEALNKNPLPDIKPECTTVVLWPQCTTETTTEVQTETTTQSRPETTTEVQTETTTQSRPETTTEIQTETTTQSRPETTTEVQTETTTQSRPETTTEVQTETTTQSRPETTTEVQTETTTQSRPETTTEVQTETTTQSRPETTTETQTETTTQSQNNNTSNSMAQQVVKLVNVERAKNGLNPLTINYDVQRVAQIKSEDMRDKNYFDHNSPTYGSPFDMLKHFGVSYQTAGENIAKGQKTAESVVNAWMNSEGHRKNILNSNFTQIGVGYATKGSTTYWTQLFIR